MTSLDLAFAACGLVAVAGGLLAVTTRQVVHAALWLVVALLGVAGCVLVLGHELVALVLVLIYIGAIVVLVLFALMLTRAPIGPDRTHAVPAWRRVGAALAGAATAALLLAALVPLAGGFGGAAVARRDTSTQAVATELFGTWVWPFEALSVLLLAALVAALAVSRGRHNQVERVDGAGQPGQPGQAGTVDSRAMPRFAGPPADRDARGEPNPGDAQ
ncbi:NADH dehydrogenase subunit J [Knoellia remsis]|uniref:NADH-quinone oxidoreductase subunit J n=1 Tax=Knoellia remsis TaxID=407159 RepID=A0A2T0UIA3_9MICO|nr:NADH-quinone oxidoreductase subunit J [Knoellia remsis]PRY57567.1 NADH dehydrogenase subunit J [Knoellia remsis]